MVFGERQSKQLQKLHNKSARNIMDMRKEVDDKIALNAIRRESLKAQEKSQS